MQLLPLTLPSPEENLALDEALLAAAEAGERGETLRLWESPRPFVVVGRAGRLAEEADLAQCQSRGVPVLRRVSGGGTIVCGPGCLMYAVVLRRGRGGLIGGGEPVAGIDDAHRVVLQRMVDAFGAAGLPSAVAGTSDLVLAADHSGGPPRKFSGNSLRMKRDWLLYHGTLLYDFDLPLVSRLLRPPPREPDYRGRRPHGAFVANAPIDRAGLFAAVKHAWPIESDTQDYPVGRVAELVRTRYATAAWNAAR
ncbi:MAG: lipoate--protein ligase family protein [Planctomycetota bacterium]